MILLKKPSYAGHYIKGILHCQEYCNIVVTFSKYNCYTQLFASAGSPSKIENAILVA